MKAVSAPELTFSGAIENGFLKIYVNSLLHAAIPLKDFRGITAWVQGYWYNWNLRIKGHRKWIIEFCVEGDSVLMEYNTRDKWEKVLRVIDETIK
jgi:hypothetical protein